MHHYSFELSQTIKPVQTNPKPHVLFVYKTKILIPQFFFMKLTENNKRHDRLSECTRRVCGNGPIGSQNPLSEDITSVPCCSSKFLSHGEVKRDPFSSKSLQTLERSTPGLPVLLLPTLPVNRLARLAIVKSFKKHSVGPPKGSVILVVWVFFT